VVCLDNVLLLMAQEGGKDSAYSDMLEILLPDLQANGSTEDSTNAYLQAGIPSRDGMEEAGSMSNSGMAIGQSLAMTQGSTGGDGEKPPTYLPAMHDDNSDTQQHEEAHDEGFDIEIMSNADDECDEAIFHEEERDGWLELEHLREEVDRMKAEMERNGASMQAEDDEAANLQRMQMREKDKVEQEELERYV
jgi:hypothetical protein